LLAFRQNVAGELTTFLKGCAGRLVFENYFGDNFYAVLSMTDRQGGIITSAYASLAFIALRGKLM